MASPLQALCERACMPQGLNWISDGRLMFHMRHPFCMVDYRMHTMCVLAPSKWSIIGPSCISRDYPVNLPDFRTSGPGYIHPARAYPVDP